MTVDNIRFRKDVCVSCASVGALQVWFSATIPTTAAYSTLSASVSWVAPITASVATTTKTTTGTTTAFSAAKV